VIVIPAPVKVNVAVPVFCRPTTCGELLLPTTWLAKVTLLVPRVTIGATPMPDSDTICGLPGKL